VISSHGRDNSLCIVKKVCSMKMTTQEQRAPQRIGFVWPVWFDRKVLIEKYAGLVQ